MLEFAAGADAELEAPIAAVAGIALDGDAVIEAERAEVRNIEPDAKTVVVVVVSKVHLVRPVIDHTNIIEHREAQKFNNRHAVFGGPEPVGVAAQRLAGRVARTDLAIAIAAQRIDAAKEPAVEKRHAGSV